MPFIEILEQSVAELEQILERHEQRRILLSGKPSSEEKEKALLTLKNEIKESRRYLEIAKGFLKTKSDRKAP